MFGKYVDMDHNYYFDGDQKRISWVIENSMKRSEEIRLHPENFYNKVTIEQSKYIALHVGIFWGVGRFILKNYDVVTIMLDQNSMFDNLTKNQKCNDKFIEGRTRFIKQIIERRGLDVKYNRIEPQQNKATNQLYS
jgi:hypothetical protein